MHEGKKKTWNNKDIHDEIEAVKKSINADCVPILHWF